MAVDMFLKIDGIPGESEDKKHSKEIDVLAWSWGLSQSGTMHVGGGGGAGKANFQDLSITKWVDSATVPLLKACTNGQHIKKAELFVRKAGGKPLEYMVYTFEELLVSSVSQGGSGGEDRLTENVSLNFRSWHLKYTAQTAQGAEGDKFNFGHNIAKNEEYSV